MHTVTVDDSVVNLMLSYCITCTVVVTLTEAVVLSALDIGLIDEVSKEILVLEANLSTYSRELLSEEGRPTDSRQHALVDEPVLSPSSLKGTAYYCNYWVGL